MVKKNKKTDSAKKAEKDTQKKNDSPIKEASSQKEESPASKKKDMIEFIVYLAVVIALVYLIITFVGQRTVVNGCSMDNTLKDGQSLIMDKISYRFGNPGRFDIVVFPGPAEEFGSGDSEEGPESKANRPYYIKRVIGLPGETVDIVNNKVYIDGNELTSDIYSIDGFTEDPGELDFPMTLKDNEYFCLGDNRPQSYDSRYEAVGTVSRDEIIGKVWIRIWPLNKFGSVD